MLPTADQNVTSEITHVPASTHRNSVYVCAPVIAAVMSNEMSLLPVLAPVASVPVDRLVLPFFTR